jgi:hypothetical protein
VEQDKQGPARLRGSRTLIDRDLGILGRRVGSKVGYDIFPILQGAHGLEAMFVCYNHRVLVEAMFVCYNQDSSSLICEAL